MDVKLKNKTMKRLFLCLTMLIGSNSNTHAKPVNDFDVDKFEKALILQMEITFPFLKLDTTLNFATRATSQAEAGYPECYATKKGGMVNTANDEIEEAKKLVSDYKNHIESVLHFDDQSLKKCNFTEFSATATAQYGGLVRYGIVIDNNFSRASLGGISSQLENSTYQEEVNLVDSLVLDHYGDHMIIDNGFDIGCVNYVKEKTESKKIPWVEGQAHYHFSISSADGMPSKKSIEEIIKERLNYLDSLGLPLTIGRYYIKVIVEGDKTYLILALDNN
jgi:hypothetical protein